MYVLGNCLVHIVPIRMFLGLPDPDQDPDQLLRGTDPDPSIIKQKIARKALIPTFFLLMSWIRNIRQ